MAGMCAVIDLTCARHDNPAHPESHARLLSAIGGIPEKIPRYTPAPAAPEDIHRIHDPLYTQWLRERCRDAVTIANIDSDTYVTPYSFDAACMAAGGAIAAAERALKGEHAFAFVRPPGHHAERSRAMGFCLLNNAAIAAKKILDQVERVAIVDWDIHHGNGTQNAFYLSNRVLYCSVHHEHHFPHTGHIDEIGNGTGKGLTINAPLSAGSSIADYHAVFSEVFVPALERFRPDALIVSAGQDILFDDPLGGMMIMPEDFGILTTLLAGSVDHPLSFVLEGGYSDSHGDAIAAIYAALAHPADISPGAAPKPHTRKVIDVLKKVHHFA